MAKKGQATSINHAIPIADEVKVTSFDGQEFTIYHPKSRPSFRALMACWLASDKRLELRQAGQGGTFSKLDCWRLTDDLRSAKGKSAVTFDKVVRRALASKFGITKAVASVKAKTASKVKASKDGKDVLAILTASGLSAKAAKAIAAAIAS